MGWKTIKINHPWKVCLKTGKLLFPLLGGTWVMLVLCVLMETFNLLKTEFWALSPPLWEALPHFSSTSWVVIYSSMNFSKQQQCWLIWTLLSQYLTHFISALKINFALTKAECSCEPAALGALCCCCLLLFRSSLSVLLFHLGCFLCAQTSWYKLNCFIYSSGSGALGFSFRGVEADLNLCCSGVSVPVADHAKLSCLTRLV